MRISYARVLVEIDITQDIPEEIEVNDPYERVFTQQVVFDWKPDYCQTCLSVGHDCKKKLETTTITQQGDGGNGRRRKKRFIKSGFLGPKLNQAKHKNKDHKGRWHSKQLEPRILKGKYIKSREGFNLLP